MPHRHAPYPRFCLACHGQRLASLLETASALRLYRLAPPSVIEEGAWSMPDEGLAGLAGLLARADVALLVCGGATCCCLTHFRRTGVAVAPWIAGDIDTVIEALLHNRLETLLAPGARPCRLPGPGRGVGLTGLEKGHHERKRLA